MVNFCDVATMDYYRTMQLEVMFFGVVVAMKDKKPGQNNKRLGQNN